MRELVSHQVKSFNKAGKFALSGPDILLEANAVLNIGMALHELIVNPVQYADLDQSSVAIGWQVDEKSDQPQCQMSWGETNIRNPDLLEQGNGLGLWSSNGS